MAFKFGTLALTALLQVGALTFGSMAMAQSVPMPPRGVGATMDIGDQPGREAPADDEVSIDPAYRRQPVYFRTTEAPGTIIISTNDRFLYLVQGNNRACATASVWAGTASPGRGS